MSIPLCLGAKYNKIQESVCRGALSEEMGPEVICSINLDQKDWFYPKVFCALDLSDLQCTWVLQGCQPCIPPGFAWDSATFPGTVFALLPLFPHH